MLDLGIPQKYYEKEGFLSVMGLGYTAALAVIGLGLLSTIQKKQYGLPAYAILGGGVVATWGYLKSSGVLY